MTPSTQPAARPLFPDIPSRAAYLRIRRQPAPWRSALRAVCDRHGLDPTAAQIQRQGSGVLWRLAEGPWLKLLHPSCRAELAAERAGLRTCGALDGVEVPEILAEGELEGWPYLLLSHVGGRQLSEIWGDLSPRAQADLAYEIGGLLSRLHALEVADPAALAVDWPAWVRAAIDAAPAHQASRGAPGPWLAPLRARLSRLPAMDRGEPVFLHTDINDEHLFAREIGGRWRVTGLIDFGDATIGDPEYDLSAPLISLAQRRPRVQRALLEGYGVARSEQTDALAQRLVGWCLIRTEDSIADHLEYTPGPAPRSLSELAGALWSRS